MAESNRWLSAFLDHDLLDSVRSTPNPRNQAIAALLAKNGSIQQPALALDTYNQICCLSGTIGDCAQLGLMLLAPPLPLTSETTRTVQTTLVKSGLYELSSTFYQRTGFACKSAVSGLMMACLPVSPPAIFVGYSPPSMPRAIPLSVWHY